jgi:hypothetical protein
MLAPDEWRTAFLRYKVYRESHKHIAASGIVNAHKLDAPSQANIGFIPFTLPAKRSSSHQKIYDGTRPDAGVFK